MKSIYLIGSLRNPNIPHIGNKLREIGYDVFDAWWSASEDADDWWQKHEQEKGSTYSQALKGHAAQNVYRFDRKHLTRCDIGLLVMPAGKSAHLELGFIMGQDKPGYVLFDKEPDRWDVMYNFCTDIYFSEPEMVYKLWTRELKDKYSS